MPKDFLWLALGPPFPAAVLEIANQLLLRRIHRDHWLLRRQGLGHALVEISELRIKVFAAVTFFGLPVALEREPPLL